MFLQQIRKTYEPSAWWKSLPSCWSAKQLTIVTVIYNEGIDSIAQREKIKM